MIGYMTRFFFNPRIVLFLCMVVIGGWGFAAPPELVLKTDYMTVRIDAAGNLQSLKGSNGSLTEG